MTVLPAPNPRHSVALVLVDVNRSFFEPDGEFYYAETSQVLPQLHRLLQAARDGGRLVIHAREIHRPGLHDFELTKLPRHSEANDRNAEPMEGFEEGSDIILVAKRRYSAFFSTDLALLLGEQGVRQVVVAGVKTNVCIRATVQDAFAHGFQPVVPREAVNSNRPHLHDASLEDIERYLGRVEHIDQVITLLLGKDGTSD